MDPEQKTSTGKSALDLAVSVNRRGSHEKVIALLSASHSEDQLLQWPGSMDGSGSRSSVVGIVPTVRDSCGILLGLHGRRYLKTPEGTLNTKAL